MTPELTEEQLHAKRTIDYAKLPPVKDWLILIATNYQFDIPSHIKETDSVPTPEDTTDILTKLAKNTYEDFVQQANEPETSLQLQQLVDTTRVSILAVTGTLDKGTIFDQETTKFYKLADLL